MDRYASEPDNATKVAKAKWSNLRVHFKVSFKFFDRELRFTRDPRKLFVVVVDCTIYSNCDVFRHLLALDKSRHVWAMQNHIKSYHSMMMTSLDMFVESYQFASEVLELKNKS